MCGRWMRLYHQLMAQGPTAHAMSREGKGTQAASEAGHSQPLSWSDVEQRLVRGGWFWLATVGPNGAPHVMPLFAAWADTRFFIASKERARKSRNLEVEPRCVITTDTGDLHLVIEGVTRHVHDEATLQRAVAAFHAVYQWQPELWATSWTPTTAPRPRVAHRTRSTKSPQSRHLAFRPTVRP